MANEGRNDKSMTKRAIFITGASSGIGLATALRLQRAGFQVFAGVYPGEDSSALPSEHVTLIPIDITKPAMIAAAARTIADAVGEAGLYGLFNNAGAAYSGPMEFVPAAVIRQQLEVNVIGHVEVTQAMMPLLRKARGRIVNTASIAGRVATPLLGPYTMSKFAMEAYTDALRLEVSQFGVHVAAVEPGVIATPIWEKGLSTADEIWDEMPEAGRQLYAAQKQSINQGTQTSLRRAISPDEVARQVEHAFTAPRPKTRYLVGADARLLAFLKWCLPDRLMDRAINRLVGG